MLRALVLSRVRYALAGWAAESIYRAPERLIGVTVYDDPDQADARAMLRAWYPNDRSGVFAQLVIQGEYRRVRAWLREHWLHVEAIAAALLKHDEIDEEQIRDVLDALPWMRHPGYR